MHGKWRTLDRATELGVGGVELFYRSMELWLDLGLSFVADQTFYRGVSEPDVLARLAPHGRSSRCTARAPTPAGGGANAWKPTPSADPTGCAAWCPVIERLDVELVQPLDLGCPTLVVRTDDGYDPSLEAVTSTIDTLYSRPLVHASRPGGSATDHPLNPAHHPSSRSRGSSIPKWWAISWTTTR